MCTMKVPYLDVLVKPFFLDTGFPDAHHHTVMPKRIKVNTDLPPEPAAEPVQVEPFAERPSAAERSPSLSLRFKDGKADWEGQRTASRERWAAFMRDPETLSRFNLTPASVGQAPILVDPQFVHSALDFLGEFQAQIIRQKYKLTLDEARAIALYSSPEKEMITPPAQRVLSKRAPDFIQKYGDEIILGVTLANIARVKFALAAEKAKKAERQPLSSPSPASEDNQEEAAEEP